MSEHIKTGADIANEITSYEAMHEPSLNTKEYQDLVGGEWIPLPWLKEEIEKKIAEEQRPEKHKCINGYKLDAWNEVLSLLEQKQ